MNLKKKYVVVGGQVCLREGVLEMFACPRGTKEHESVVSTNSPARFVHAGLLMIGARSGPPMQYHPEYKPAGGTEIDVEVVWEDAQGTLKRVRAQEWVKYIRTGKALDYPWVFAGSLFLMDEAAQERYYCADGGEMICVSNFSTAMLDLPVESGDANDNLMFAAFTENIPPLRTPVNLILTPKRPEKVDESEKQAAKDAPSPDGTVKPDVGNATPDAGKPAPDAGKPAPDAGKPAPDAGKAPPDAKGSEAEQSKQPVGTTGK
ncbi:MAG: hypothetical protein FJ276_37855 [Planctomycetes bacterium]|nr:hypothetical protein [Planctomycetota bacterium]